MKLFKEHLDDLKASGLSDEVIALWDPKSLTVEEARTKGYYCNVHLITGEEVQLLDEQYVKSCLHLPFRGLDGRFITGDGDGKILGVVKDFFQESVSSQFLEKPPKYLCLPKHVQKRQYVHFPATYDWSSYMEKAKSSEEPLPLFICEGLKKSEAGCMHKIPCIGAWAPWNLCESGMDSDLIPELSELLKENFVPVFVLDSDKVSKPSVLMAEKAGAAKIFIETGKIAKAVDLPSSVNGKSTKGLDDYLLQATKQDFYQLYKQARPVDSALLRHKVLNKRPDMPFEAQPKLFKLVIRDLESKLEGPLELVSQALTASAAAVLRNRFRIDGKCPNVNTVGLSPTSTGKTQAANAVLRSFRQINSELLKKYQEELSTYEEEISEEDESDEEA